MNAHAGSLGPSLSNKVLVAQLVERPPGLPMCSQKECPTKFETRWLQEIPFSKELTDNYCALGLLFESITCNNNNNKQTLIRDLSFVAKLPIYLLTNCACWYFSKFETQAFYPILLTYICYVWLQIKVYWSKGPQIRNMVFHARIQGDTKIWNDLVSIWKKYKMVPLFCAIL